VRRLPAREIARVHAGRLRDRCWKCFRPAGCVLASVDVDVNATGWKSYSSTSASSGPLVVRRGMATARVSGVALQVYTKDNDAGGIPRRRSSPLATRPWLRARSGRCGGRFMVPFFGDGTITAHHGSRGATRASLGRPMVSHHQQLPLHQQTTPRELSEIARFRIIL
jgi:hypothetical protein